MNDPVSAAPRIPTPPPRAARRKRSAHSARLLIWLAALALGVAAGILGYRESEQIAFYFDYWVALALS
jgi:hypothetical protein